MLKKIRGLCIAIMVIASLVLNSGCGVINKVISARGDDEKVSLGTMEGTTYKNDYFGISINTDGWTVLSEKEKNQVYNAGKDSVAGDNEKMKEDVEQGLSSQRYLSLLTMYEKPLGSQDYYNPSISFNAEKISLMQGIKNGKDYLKSAKKLLQQMKQISYKFDKEIYSENVGGKNFDVLEVTAGINEMTITQKYFTVIIKGYAFNFVVSYATDEQKQKLDDVLKTVVFK